MPLALILSSYVASSRVGGGGQQFALAPFGIDPLLVPTVLFGRHPGLGPPGGAAVTPQMFASVLDAAMSRVARTYADAVITGYFASPEQVEIAAAAIDDLRAAEHREAITGRLAVVVDPIMGDEGVGLYVPEPVAEAIARLLVPRADWLTPNPWELARLTGVPITGPEAAAEAAGRLGCAVLATSVPLPCEEIGLVCVADGRARLYAHTRQPTVPRGTGDLVAAVLAAGLIEAPDPWAAAERAAQAAAETALASTEWGADELPLVALGGRLVEPTAAVRADWL